MDAPEILYHYCSTNTFYKIISERTIRLSALSFSNDYLEGRLARRAIQFLSEKHKLNEYQKSNIHDLMDIFENSFDSHGFCLSENGDLLSQWRGYADDGNGLSIGFSSKYLNNLIKVASRKRDTPLLLSKVFYEEEAHIEIVQPIFDEVLTIINNPDFDARFFKGLLSIPNDPVISERIKTSSRMRLKLLEAMSNLLPKMFILKTNAFFEESEWRLMEYSVNREISLGDYVPYRNKIKPFHDLELETIDDLEPILSIFLGPKHETKKLNLIGFLKQHNFNNVNLIFSSASYR